MKSDRPRPLRYKKIIAAIHTHCKRIEAIDDGQFQNEIEALRREIHRDGFTEDFMVQAFALIREAAWRSLGMRHFDCQLMGGWIMARGGLAEMETGEGKSLTATLAAGTAALAGIPVHIITVNDYLVDRDSSQMAPLYSLLGVTVAGVTSTQDANGRRARYQADIVYCTNKQLAFDYLRDRMMLGSDQNRLKVKFGKLCDNGGHLEQLFLRGLCFAIVDEADSVLIDEAGTPLIISREVQNAEATKIYSEALKVARSLKRGVDYSLDYQNRTVVLQDGGRDCLSALTGGNGSVKIGLRQAEELITQALSACHIYRRDRHYLVQGGKILIIDENTGRVMADRSWEKGLHQLIELKEDCEVTGQREHIARLTYQRFFSRYLCLSGMSGTVSEVRHEIREVYGVPVEKIITNRKSRRRSEGTSYYCSKKEKWIGVEQKIRNKISVGQPVLVGTRSVADSEHLSMLLSSSGVQHKVLNARQDSNEAEKVALAGGSGNVTVATNMAGRGTDIPLCGGVAERGGLHVICAELNDAKRIDRQLYGRCGRQGEPGSYETVMSSDDELFCWCFGKNKIINKILSSQSWFSSLLGSSLMRYAQKKMEKKNMGKRAELLLVEEQFKKNLAFSGSME